MKTPCLVTLILIGSTGIALSSECVKTVIKGQANNGESACICVLGNGEYRYEQIDIWGNPVYKIDVERAKTGLFYQKTEHSVGKQFYLEANDRSYYFEYIITDGEPYAKATVSGVDGVVSEVNINPKTVEDHIDLNVIKAYNQHHPNIKNQ